MTSAPEESPAAAPGLWIGVDDTDSPDGGCTTALAALLLARFSPLHPLGPPRLVRLNPNVPWKTRGNAAIALAFRDKADLDETLAAVRAIVQSEAKQHPGTEPGIVVSARPLPLELYRAAVTRVVERAEVDEAIAKADARAWGGRGVIGAAAAIAWEPPRGAQAPLPTYERIAYRAPAKLGTPRAVAAAWVREVEWGYPTTFDSYDLENDEVVCVPSGPDPVLWGLRGTDPLTLEKASALLGPERPVRETLFLTNQASDDHLVDRHVAGCSEYLSARVRGRVSAAPLEQHGSVFVDLADDTGVLRAAAYPPTRQLRRIARALRAGDELTVCGGIHKGPDGRLTLGIEKMLVHQTSPRPAGAPLCPTCGKTMESAGKGQKYRCRGCHTRAEGSRTADSIVRPGWHEVPASARRHLARPMRLAPRSG